MEKNAKQNRFTDEHKAWWNWFLADLDYRHANMCPDCYRLTLNLQGFKPRASQSNASAVEEKKKKAVGSIGFHCGIEQVTAKPSVQLSPHDPCD